MSGSAILNAEPGLNFPECGPGSETRSRIHEHTISLRFPGLILGYKVSLYNIYIANQFQNTLTKGGGV